MPALFPAAVVKQLAEVPADRTTPLWAGPRGAGPLGGVTQSMIGRYLACGERFRVQYVEGWQANDRFSPALEYGNMWHACEEAHAANLDWTCLLEEQITKLHDKYPFQRSMVDEWAQKCVAQFPAYVEHWASHPDMMERTPLLQEHKFDVGHVLPSGRIVRLRGKFDSVDLVTGGDGAGIWLMENKTKSGIDRQKIERQLRFDLQTCAYLIALREVQHDVCSDKPGDAEGGFSHPIRGVRYNVVRRSAHKTVASMMKKINEDREEGRINEWFERWNVEVSEADLARFRRQCLDPVLENLCDDYEWWSACLAEGIDPFNFRVRDSRFPHHRPRCFRYPYGTYSPVAEGGFGDVDEYLENGTTAGLHRATTLFPELN